MRQLRVPLSTPWTPLLKFGLPVVLVALWLAFAIGGGDGLDSVQGLSLLALAVVALLWACAGIVRVDQQGTTLVISNYRREERIGADQIEHVTRFWWARPGAVTIRFREHTSFGRTVSFVPEESVLSMLGFWWLDQEPVEHLRELARKAGGRVPRV